MEDILNELYKTILARKDIGEDGSYTAYLFDKGLEKILKKVGEESTEVVISSLGDNKDNQVNEMCDLIYHLLVLMAELGISLEDIKEELEKRSKKGKTFYGCDNYPACDFVSWHEPTENKCPECGSLMAKRYSKAKGDYLECINAECKHKEILEKKE